MADIFLSYADEDKGRISHIVATLERRGWSVWWDRKIPPGKRFDQVIEQALEAARCVVVIWSRRAVESEWVQNEAYEGLQRKILIPILIEEAKIPFAFRRIETALLTGWEGAPTHPELRVLLESIEAVVGPRNAPARVATAKAGEKGGAVKTRRAAKRKPAEPPASTKPEPRAGTKSSAPKSRGSRSSAKEGGVARPASRSGARTSPAPKRASTESGGVEAAGEAMKALLLEANVLFPEQAPAKSVPQPPSVEAAAKTRRAEEIRKLLRAYLPQSDLFVEPDIPASKLMNARASCEVPPDEQVLGLINCTNFGSAKDCLLFGTEGVYFHNGWTGSPTGRHFIPYSEFANREFKTALFLNVNLGGNLYLECSACSVPRSSIVEILTGVKALVS